MFKNDSTDAPLNALRLVHISYTRDKALTTEFQYLNYKTNRPAGTVQIEGLPPKVTKKLFEFIADAEQHAGTTLLGGGSSGSSSDAAEGQGELAMPKGIGKD